MLSRLDRIIEEVLYCIIFCGILIFEKVTKVTHDITIGRQAAGIKVRLRIAKQPYFSCASCGSHFCLLNLIKLCRKTIYVFSRLFIVQSKKLTKIK